MMSSATMLTRLLVASGLLASSEAFMAPGIVHPSRLSVSMDGGVNPPASARAPTSRQPAGKVVRTNKKEPPSTIFVQGGSLRTWSYRSPAVEQVQVILSTEGRPMDADIELWNGPDNSPCKVRVYVENGRLRPFSAVLETPRGPNTIAIRNIGQMEFPIAADLFIDDLDEPSPACLDSWMSIQGGALRTYPFDSTVETVQFLLQTDGRPLKARIELLQGPNNNKQIIELYTEDGLDRPFFGTLFTPGAGNVVRVVNTAPVEFPMTASVVAHTINSNARYDDYDGVVGGDVVLGGDMGPGWGGGRSSFGRY